MQIQENVLPIQSIQAVEAPPPQKAEKATEQTEQSEGKSFKEMLQELMQGKKARKTEPLKADIAEKKAVQGQEAAQDSELVVASKELQVQERNTVQVKKVTVRSNEAKEKIAERSDIKSATVLPQELTQDIATRETLKHPETAMHDTPELIVAEAQSDLLSPEAEDDATLLAGTIAQKNVGIESKSHKNEKADEKKAPRDAKKVSAKHSVMPEIDDDALARQTKAAKTAQSKKAVFSVQDERSALAADANIHSAGAEQRVETESPTVDFKIGAKAQALFDNQTPQAVQTRAESGMTTAPQGAAQSFSDLLAQEIRTNAPDFVQAGKIILRDHNQGTIRLSLRPAHLGAVNINLELSGDKKIRGTLMVQTREAYEAVEKSMETLIAAFEENGFDSADFNLSQNGFNNEQSDYQPLFAGAHEADKKIAESIMLNRDSADVWSSPYAEQSVNVLA